MKQIRLLTAFCLTIIALSACSEEDASPDPPAETPGITLTERIISDGGIVDRTEEFYYNEARQLTRRVMKQQFTVTVNGITDTDSLRLENKVTYATDEVTVTDASDNVSTYLLNDQGYATSCIRREVGTKMARLYTFGYSDDGTLAAVMEIINGKIVSQLTFRALTETTATFCTENGEISSTFLLTLGEENTSRLPWLYLTEQYPLNLHQDALYAQLLGKSPTRLIQSLRPETGDERTTYTYTTDGAGNLSSCKESFVSYGDTYRRTVNYLISF